MSEPRRFWGTEAASGLALISPTAIFAILLLAAPLAATLLYSVLTDGYLIIEPTFTLENYTKAWSSPVMQSIMLRSVSVAMLVTLTTVLLAYPVAYFVSFNVAPDKKGLWLFLITIPFWTSYVIRVFMWNVMLGRSGVVNSALISVGVIDTPLDLSFSVQSMVITLSHAYAPFAILPIYVALEKIDRSLLEAGQDLGETRWTTFLRVTLPLSMSGVVAAVLIVFIPVIGDYVTPELVGGGKFPMIANVIETQMLKSDNRPLGAAIAASTMLIVGLVSLVFLFLNRRYLRATR
jgi:spermidine/putrescine transport system permease protein